MTLRHTPLIDCHRQDGAKLVDFSGWEMPIHYGSQIEEHHQVRQNVGLFDVSHMTVVDVAGADAEAYLSRLLSNNVTKVPVGKAVYSAMLNHDGGILDDLIVYRLATGFRLVVNCATREKDLDWMRLQAASFEVSIETPEDYVILAVQGPNSLKVLRQVLVDAESQLAAKLKPFECFVSGSRLIARTGYTGESGFECIVDAADGIELWQSLRRAGAAPIGLGARDTLRLEAGMNLYGQDMDEETCPSAANLSWTVALDDRAFIGRAGLSDHPRRDARQIGVKLIGRGVLRSGYPLVEGDEVVGVMTSGAFSPTLECGIGLARIDREVASLAVEIRGKRQPVEVMTLPFVPRGQFASS
ncbi:MAG: glycine cleavage system aminomethyltransferase GcvT [Pseudomonadales bacterium]